MNREEVAALAQINTQPYPNRWIAVYMGRVIGVGLTPEQAYRAAKQARPQREPSLFFIGANGKRMMSQEWLSQHPLLGQVIPILQDRRLEAYLVGGAVRDLLMGRTEVVDLDFATPHDGLKVARQVANQLTGAAFYALDEARGTGRVICADKQKSHLDFATFRGSDLLSDLADRDFTINAMAISLTDLEQVIDPFQGQVDLQAQRIQAIHEMALLRDPIRALRAIRQAIEFNFTIEPQTANWLGNLGSQILTPSPERQRDELLKLLNTPAPGQAIRLLQHYQLLPHLLPEVNRLVGLTQSFPHHLDVFDHTCLTLDMWAKLTQHGFNWPLEYQPVGKWADKINSYLQEDLAGQVTLQKLMPVAVLFHDLGKAVTQRYENGRFRFLGHEQESAKMAVDLMNRFRFSGSATDFVVKVVTHHMRPLNLAQTGHVNRRTLYRLFRDTQTHTIAAGPAVALHALADHCGTYAPNTGEEEAKQLVTVVDKLLTAYFEQRDQVVNPPMLLTGRDLIQQFGLRESPLIGQLLRRLQEAQASGEVVDHAAALTFIQTELSAK